MSLNALAPEHDNDPFPSQHYNTSLLSEVHTVVKRLSLTEISICHSVWSLQNLLSLGFTSCDSLSCQDVHTDTNKQPAVLSARQTKIITILPVLKGCSLTWTFLQALTCVTGLFYVGCLRKHVSQQTAASSQDSVMAIAFQHPLS